jgi:hypothetical protein
MRSLVLLALFFAACNPNRPGGEEDPDDPTGDGRVTVDIGTAEGFQTPLYAAVSYGDGWTTIPLDSDQTEVEVPKDSEVLQAVTVCPGPWEGTHEVFWLHALVTMAPEPQLHCPNLDESALDVVTGTATGTYDLVQVSLGDGNDTFFPYMGEEFEIATRSGDFDLVAIPQGGATPPTVVARPRIASYESIVQALDFATGGVPGGLHRVILDDAEPAPYYVEVNGRTENGTTFYAGNEEYYLPPSSTGVTTEYVVSQFVYESAEVWYLSEGTDVGDVAPGALVAGAEPLEAEIFRESDGSVTYEPVPPSIFHAETWYISVAGSETRSVYTALGGEALPPWNIDVGQLIGFPEEATGEPEDEFYAWAWADTNATIDDVVVSYFAGMTRDMEASRYGVVVDDDYPGAPADGFDVVAFHDGLLLVNDTGMLVSR